MKDSGKEPIENDDLQDFKEAFRKRFLKIKKHGDVEKVAELLGVTPNTVSRWGTPNYSGLPTIYQAKLLGEHYKIRPEWLAFDNGDQPSTQDELELVKLFRQLPEGSRELMRGVVARFIQAEGLNTKPAVQTPALPRVEIDHDAGVMAITPPAKDPRELARESGQTYTKPPKKPKRMDRRHEYRIIPYSTTQSPGAVNIPCFSAVAAGFGADLEPSEDLVYVRELPDWRGVHSLIVRGDSMEDTLHPRDLVMIETFNNGDGITLEGLAPEDAKTPYQQVQKRIPDDEIFVLSIDDEPPTIKRVIYDTHKPQDWHLVITADNPDYKLRVLTRGTPIRFYGRLIAIGQKDGEKQYTTVKPGQEYPKHIEDKLKRNR